jgi:hypothetical protein
MSNFLIDEDTDLLAAEFVLGTLDSEERANAQSLLRVDHGFIAMVRIWERRFGELHLMVEPVEPDATILQRIKAKILEIAPSEPAPDGKPPAEVTASPEPPEATGSSASAEMPEPVKVATGGETPGPQGVLANGTTPQPAEISATGETEQPAETPPAPDSVVPAATEVQPSPESQAQDSAVRSEPGPTSKVAVPPPPLKLPDKVRDQPAGERPDITMRVIRSRSRWRIFGLGMTLLVVGLGALLAAWRFVPDRLPAGLRPAQLMMSIGIEPIPKAAPAIKPPPPQAQFDE